MYYLFCSTNQASLERGLRRALPSDGKQKTFRPCSGVVPPDVRPSLLGRIILGSV